jgi:hypothetical protein
MAKRKSRTRRAGSLGGLFNQAIVPLSVLGMQQMYKPKRGNKKSHRYVGGNSLFSGNSNAGNSRRYGGGNSSSGNSHNANLSNLSNNSNNSNTNGTVNNAAKLSTVQQLLKSNGNSGSTGNNMMGGKSRRRNKSIRRKSHRSR